VYAAVMSFAVNFILSLALMKPMGTVGLAIASNVAIVVQAVYLQIHLARKHEGLGFHHVARDLVKVIAAALIMGALVAAGRWGWLQLVAHTKRMDALGLVLLILVGAGVYAVLLWLLKIEGRDDLAAVLKRRREKRV
jgi:putative peptidoglycan lipid II flippase